MLTPVGLPKPKTVDDLYALGEDVRAELYDGEIVQKAIPSGEHSSAETQLSAWLVRRFGRNQGERWPGGWRIFTEIHVVYTEHRVYCHDLAGWHRDRMPTLSKGWAQLRPDWVCEVLSPNHKKRDLVTKLATLHAAGVQYYWVIDREDKILMLYRHQETGYVLRSVAAGEVIRAEPFDAVELRTGVIFDDEDDEE